MNEYSQERPDPRHFYPNFDQMEISDQNRVTELANISALLANSGTDAILNNVKVPLSHFNFFAPYFMGTKPIGDEYVANGDVLRNMWLACCGSLQHDVNVFVDNNPSEIVMVVPAYMDTDMLNVNPAQLSGESFNRARLNMEGELNFPEQAVNNYQRSLLNRAASAISEQAPLASRQRKALMWAKIFSFYGVTPQNPNPQSSNGQSVAQLGDPNHDPFGSFGGFNGSL